MREKNKQNQCNSGNTDTDILSSNETANKKRFVFWSLPLFFKATVMSANAQ